MDACRSWAQWALSVGGGYYMDTRGRLVIVVPEEYRGQVPGDVVAKCNIVFVRRFRTL
ncbi:MAG: hypothetical protein ACP5MH_07275 [Thermoproteus sp.]